MNEAIEAMEAATTMTANEYMREPTAARLEHLALVHLEALIQRGMEAGDALDAAGSATLAALDKAYSELTGREA